MRQSEDCRDDETLTLEKLRHLLERAVEDLDVKQARREVAPFILGGPSLDVWSQDLFRQIIRQIAAV
jgi:hypothetical protein